MTSFDSSEIDPRTRAFLASLRLPGGPRDVHSIDRAFREGREAVRRGLYTQAEISFRQASSLARGRGDEVRAARAELQLARVLVEKRVPIAAAETLNALADAPLSGAERATWHVVLGHLLRGFSRHELADAHFRQATRAREEIQDARLAGYALVERAALRSIVGETGEAIRYYEQGISILRYEGSPVSVSIGLTNLGANLVHHGDTDRAIRHLEDASALQGPDASPSITAPLDLHLAEIAILEGEIDTARALTRQAGSVLERSGLHGIRLHIEVLWTILDEEREPGRVLADLGGRAERLRTSGLYEESAMFHSLAAIHGERHDMPNATHLKRSREILGVGAAEAYDVHHRRLFEAVGRRRRRGVLRPPGPPFREEEGEPAPVGEDRILLFSRDARTTARLESTLPPDHAVTVVRSPGRLRVLAPGAGCVVVVEPSLAGSVARQRLADLKRRSPFLPLVVVTERDAENVRHLVELEVDAVVWLSAPGTIGDAVRRARGGTLLRWAARAFASMEGLDATLRGALVHLCGSAEPVRGVGDLADAVERHRTTLSRSWKREVGEVVEWRLQDVVAWVVLLRAMGRKSPDQGWAGVAHDLGVHVQTLRGYAERLVGLGLSDLDAAGQRTAALRFVEQVVEPLRSIE